jgi:type VI secretion system protein ImpG
MGGEFAQEFPKIAARLGLNSVDVPDPYVERLLEGVAFLAARVHLRLDAEFPRFTQALLETIYPHYLAPTPSMVIAQCVPDYNDPALANGFTIARGSALQGQLAGDDLTACEFRTAHDVRLWPIEIVSANYFSFAPDLPLNTLPVAAQVRGGIRIKLRSTAALTFDQTAIERLPLYFSGRDDVANQLYELCMTSALGVLVGASDGSSKHFDFLSRGSVRPVGFTDSTALLPVTHRSFQGYRLIQEYFAFPQRFRFAELADLAPTVKRAHSNELEVVILLGRGYATLESVVDASHISLFCTPAINLFSKRADRIHVSDGAYEYHVVADRTRPVDFEIYEVTEVVGHTVGAESEQRFLPLYSADSTDGRNPTTAYFTTRREPRLVSSAQQRRGTRSSYIGTEVFLSLVDAAQAPFSTELRQLSIQTVCTNRDLPLQMPVGIGKSDLSLDIAAPVVNIRIVAGPTRPHAPLADGAVAWRAINHLSVNYLSISNARAQEAVAALRNVLELYASANDVSARRQIESITGVRVSPIVRRLPSLKQSETRASTLAFGRGLEIVLDVNELGFEGGSAYVLGSVLAHYFSSYVSINSFTETVLRSQSRGEINRWMPEWGARPTL